jgi:hypothetical protein
MFTIGIDFGANSAPALVVRSADGAEFGVVVGYPSGDEGVLHNESDHHLARQAPPALPGTCDSPSTPHRHTPHRKMRMNVHIAGPRRARTSDKEVDDR